MASGHKAQPLKIGAKILSRHRTQAVSKMMEKASFLLQEGYLDEAEKAYQDMLTICPEHCESLTMLGAVYLQQGRLDEAEKTYKDILVLQPQYCNAFTMLAMVYRQRRNYEEAASTLEASLKINPNQQDAFYNLALILQSMERDEEALLSFDHAIALNPSYADAYWNKALLKLRLGHYEEGWELYEWRWKTELKEFAPSFLQPLWLGQESLAGKTIFLHAEQGLGDTIQFCRYVSMVEALGAKVILAIPESLSKLTSTLKGSFQIITDRKLAIEFDYHCPLMSLPLAFKTTLETIPAGTYLYADSIKKIQWKERLGVKTKPRIGVVWSGSREFKYDRKRSIPFDTFSTLLSSELAEFFDFHSLQREICTEYKHSLSRVSVKTHMTDLHDFSETAALISELDLVISVDTAVVHLAGALGKPVWVLLPYDPDFRWLTEREDSPWYPTARLFRQTQAGEWEGVIEAVSIALKAKKFS